MVIVTVIEMGGIMEKNYNKLMDYFMNNDKEECVKLVLNLLRDMEIDVVTLYSDVLTPALNKIECHLQEEKYCIWQEHIKSAIVRTIIECCYPYVLRERDLKGKLKDKKVIVLCPDGEGHEIGAKMVADFFTIEGYQTTFIGASTPKSEFIDVINIVKPDIIAISVTNYYNLVATKDIIREIRGKSSLPLKVVVGGNAFINNPKAFDELGADDLLQSHGDIEGFNEEDGDYVTTP